jgi:type IV secretion system protein VirB1
MVITMAVVLCEIDRKASNVLLSSRAARALPIVRIVSFCTIALLFPLPSYAAAISSLEFSELARRCAPDIQIGVIRAVAAVESHLDPLAVRDNTAHESWAPPSLAAATVLAKERLNNGHSIDIGLMQINSGNFASLGIGVDDAFDACRSLAAARRILLTAFSEGSSEAERQAAVLITLSRYNTGRPLAGIANGYADQVIAAQNAVSGQGWAQVSAPTGSPQWDIWGTSGAQHTSWVVTADGSSDIERAGAQSTDARAKGRTAGPPIKKGEPYEVLAYQESEPGQP